MSLSKAQSSSAFSGTLPASWGSLNVSTLYLRANRLTGVHFRTTCAVLKSVCSRPMPSMPKQYCECQANARCWPVGTPPRAHPVYRKLTRVLESPPQPARSQSEF